MKHKRVERIWRQEGLKVPQRQPKRGRLWLNDGSCIRLRPLYRGHVWSYDFVASRTHDGRALKLLTVLDEHTRECLAIVVARKIRAHDVLEDPDLFLQRLDHPLHIRRRLVRDLLNGADARVGFFVLITRDSCDDLDAIPAVRERNIGQVNPEKRFATGFLGQKLWDF